MRVVGVAVVLSIVASAALAHAQDDAPAAEPPVAPAEPPVAPADDAEPGAAAEGEELGWEPDQRGIVEPPNEPAPQAGSADSEEDVRLTSAEAMASSGPRLWLDASVGGSWVDLAALSDDRLLPQSTASSAGGVALSIAGGIHVGPLVAGARGTIGLHGPYDLAAMVFEVGARVPLWLFASPNALTMRIGAGWAWLTSSAFEAEHDGPVLPVGGPTLELGAQIDTWLTEDVTLGLAGDGMMLFTRRTESTCDEPGPGGECEVDGLDFAKPGSAVGVGGRLRLVFGVHF